MKKREKIWIIYPRHDDKKELMCEHGIGHGGIHGCDGCCSDPSFEIAWKKFFGRRKKNES